MVRHAITIFQMRYLQEFFRIVLLVSAFATSEANQATHPTVGVIRWDAWSSFNGQFDPISFYSHRCLSPEKFHYRLPFFAAVLSPTNTSYNGDPQSVMDQEILYAKHVGPHYWAFDTYCTYGPNCTTNSTYCVEYLKIAPHYCPLNPAYGLHQYLSSQYNSLMKFPLLLLGSSPCDPAVQEGYLELMVHPQFLTVLGGRPLLYLFQFDDAEANLCGGGWAGIREVFNKFLQMAINQGLKNPYMVLMDLLVLTVKNHTILLGFDAISMYARPSGTKEGLPFIDLVHVAQQWWQSANEAKPKLVPIIPTGWDARPRYEHPVPWLYEGPEHYFQPTGEELQQFFRTAISFTCQYNETVESQTMLVYAWNENSENGAPLIPTFGNGTLYIDALSQILPSYC